MSTIQLPPSTPTPRGKACLIEEFSFVPMIPTFPTWRGTKRSPTKASTRPAFRYFVTAALKKPTLIRYHSFGTDQPAKDRFDSENSNFAPSRSTIAS